MVFGKKYLLIFTIVVLIFPFIFLKDSYPFHRFGMFAEPIKYQIQNEKFYLFYKIDSKYSKNNETNFVELKPKDIPLNANAFEMQLRKYHYQKKHADFISVFDEIIKKKINLKEGKKEEKLNWKWYHVIQNKDSQNEVDSICVFSK